MCLIMAIECGILLVFIFFMYFYLYESFNTSKVCARNNGKCFSVQDKFDLEDKRDAADTLNIINSRNMRFFEYLRQKYLVNPQIVGGALLKKRQKMVKNLLNRYDPAAIVEHMPASVHNTSYVFAKGRRIGYCLREKKSGNHTLHNLPILYFVNLHELSHLAATEYNPGHDYRFWSDFKFLLKEAAAAGLYHPVDYSKNPQHYCGIYIYYNPFFDNSVI